MNRRTTVLVVLGHFIAAFTALGLPPYLTHALKDLGDGGGKWAGVLYILPTTCIAISAPFWGKLADRHGPRLLLIRAQLGLAVAYFLTSQASTPALLAFSLAVQGLLGGTFSASSAYLGAQLQGQKLGRALNLMQGSARLALLVAPILVGILIQHRSILQLYGLFCVLPLVSALLTLLLPEQAPESQHRPTTRVSLRPARRTFWLEFLFVLCTIVGFPYFIEQVQGLSPISWVPGLLFALPHFAYLAVLPLLQCQAPSWTLPMGFVLVGASTLGHLWTTDLLLLALLRLLLGVGMAMGITRINALAADLAGHLPRGQLFGVLEAHGKAGAVVAGVLSSLLSAHTDWTYGLAGAMALFTVFLTFDPTRRLHDHPDPQT